MPVSNGRIPQFWCGACDDQGGYEICHPSTDAVIGWQKCPCASLPVWKRQSRTFWRWGWERRGGWAQPRWKKTPEQLAAEAEMPF